MQITDEKLLYLCKCYGERARHFRQKFLGLLPEVYKRKLYVRKGFSSIFEFAAKLAGVSKEQVSRVLNLEERFQDKPDLHKALVSGEVSVNKLARVASIATIENQKALTEQVKIMPQKTIETFVKDEKFVRAHKLNEQTSIEPEPTLSPEVKAKLLELQRKGIDINEIILEALKKREEDIENEKQELERELLGRAAQFEQGEHGVEASRYIPVRIKNFLHKEYGTKCAIPNCQKNAEQIHHELPFFMIRNHNPSLLKPLCREHHIIAHSINLAFTKKVIEVH